MSKQRSKPTSESRQKPAEARPPALAVGWSPGVRILTSVLVALHVTAIFVAPWANQTDRRTLPPDFAVRARPPGASLADPAELRSNDPPQESDFSSPPLIAALYRIFRPYLNLTYSNHGYEFFTPNPSGSFLIGYQVKDQQGQVIAEGQYPDLDEQWPRLFYHRHMMLAAQINEFGRSWPVMIGREMLKRHRGAQVSIFFVYHRLPLPEEVAAGVALDASWLYETRHRFDIEAGQEQFRHVQGDRPEAVRIPGVAP